MTLIYLYIYNINCICYTLDKCRNRAKLKYKYPTGRAWAKLRNNEKNELTTTPNQNLAFRNKFFLKKNSRIFHKITYFYTIYVFKKTGYSCGNHDCDSIYYMGITEFEKRILFGKYYRYAS